MMKTKESALTAFALVLLAYWEVMIGEIPLGLLSIRFAEHQFVFCTVITLKLLVASYLLTRALMAYQPTNVEMKNPLESEGSY